MSKKPENKLIGKIKKHFIESTLDAEFDEHMGYQKHDQNSRDVSFMLFNNLWFKCWFAFTMALVTVFINWILINKADLISKRIIIEDNKKK